MAVMTSPKCHPSKPPKSRDATIPVMETDTSHVGANAETKASWFHLFAFVRRQHVGLLLSAVAAAMAVAGAKTSYAIILGKIFDIVSRFGIGRLNGDDTLAGVSTWCVVLTAVGAAIWLANAGFMALWIIFGEVCARSARDTIFTAMLRKDMGWFDAQGDGLSSMLVRIQGQTRELQTATSQVLGYLVCDVFISIACLVVAFYYSWKLSLVLLATIPVSILALNLISRPLEPAIEEQKLALSRGSKLANAAISAIDLVKVYNGSDQEVWQYIQAIRQAMKHYLTQARCNCLQMSYIKFWMINLFVVGFWFAVYLVDRGETTPGKALTTFYAALTAFEAIESVGPQWLVLAKGMSAGQSLHAIAIDLQRGRRIRRLEGRMHPKMCSGDIEVNDVTFAYPSNPTRTVLTQASFFFPAGEMSFLVGKSGSGKSTIGNLLLKFYEPQKGQILVDGQPLQTLDAGWVRSNITLIQQSSILFNDTLFMNVAFGHPDPENASKEEVKAACEAALLQSTIAGLSDGYNTMLGPGGYNLSGGQKQRLALARARLRDPPVLILDEVTSGLDPVSKTLIMDAIRVWRRGKTTIIVTHDVSQIQDQDYVYVLDQSLLVQEGFRRDLVCQQSGMFATLLASAGEDCDSPAPSSPLTRYHGGCGPDPGTYGATQGAPVSTMFRTLDNNIHMNHRPFHRLSLGIATAQLAGFRTRGIRDSSYITETTGSIWTPGVRHASRRMTAIDAEASAKNMTKPGDRESGEAWTNIPSARSSIEVLQDMGDAIRARRSQTTKDRKWFRAPVTSSKVARRSLQTSTGELQSHMSTHVRGEEPQLHIARIIGTVWPILDNRSRLLFMLGLSFCLVVAACNPAFAFVFAKLLQAFWAEGNRVAAGQKWAIFLTIIAAIDATSVYFAHYFMERTAQTWVNNQRTEALKRVLSQPRSWFDKPSHSAGRIVECLDRNAEEMRNIVGRFVPIIIMVASMVSAALIWALAISWKLTLVALSAGPAVYMATCTSSKVSDRWESLSNAGAQSSSVIFNEVFTNIRVVRALTLEPLFTAKHLRSTSSTFRLGGKRGLYTGIFYGLYQSMSFWLTALVFWYGTVLLRQHDHGIEVADIMQVINLLLFSMGTATMMLGSIPQISQAKTSATQLLYYASLDYHGSHEDRGRRRAMTPFPVRMSQLRFAYPGPSPLMVLRNIDLQIDAGDCVAVVGASGSGKSTIASILLQLYEPCPKDDTDEPSLPPWNFRNGIHETRRYHNETKCNAPLTFAHVPSSELDTAVLRNMMAYVPQQPFLFPASIRDNIVYGLHEESPFRDMSNVRRAAQAAGIHDFITSLPDGYQTLVGDGGLSFSGGQTQRISIARALARKPKLLVLDEPTSALDAESAEGVRNTIKQLMARAGTGGKGGSYPALDNRMAVVMVTHSKESMMMADRILVVDGGCIVEDGTYNDLVARNGKFTELVSGGVWMNQGRQQEKINNVGMKSLRTGDEGAGFVDGWSGSDFDPNDSTAVEEYEDDTSRSALVIAAARAETMEALERPRSAVVRWHRGTPSWNDR